MYEDAKREKNEEEEEGWGKIHNRFKIFRNFWDPKEKKFFPRDENFENISHSKKFLIG